MEFIYELTWEGDWTREEKEYSVSRLTMRLSRQNDSPDQWKYYTLETGLTREWDAEENVLTYHYSFDAEDGDFIPNNCSWSAYHPDITSIPVGFGLEVGIGFSPYNGRVVSRQATVCSVLMKERGTDIVYRKTYIAKGSFGLVDYFRNPFPIEKPNHTFKGWVTEEGDPFDPSRTVVNNAMTVYADWEHPDSVLKHDDTYHWYECPECEGVKLSDEELHDWGAGEVTKEPTDTETGVRTYTCSVCGHEKEETIPAKGHTHDFGTDWESDENTHWHSCSGCDSKDAESAHDWGAGEVTKEPTDTETGIRTYTCSVCGHEKEETIPAKGQSTEDGNTGNTGNDPDNTGDGTTGDDTDDKGSGTAGNDSDNKDDAATGDDTDDKGSGTAGNDPDNTGDGTTGDDTNNKDDGNHSGNNEDNNADNHAGENNDVGKEGTDNNANGGADAKTNATGGSGEPKTGDTSYVEVYATIAMILGLSYLLSYFMEDEGGISEEEKKEWISRIIRWAKKGGSIRRIVALTVIFVYLFYYHSMGKSRNITVKVCTSPAETAQSK